MTYSVNSGVYEPDRAGFPTFSAALRAYRIKRAYQLTLPKGHWFSVSIHNDDLLDSETAGLTEDEACLVYDDTVPRSLLSDSKAFHDLVCKHVITRCKSREDGLVRRECEVCGHEYLELTL